MNLKTLNETLEITKTANDKLSTVVSYKMLKPYVKHMGGSVFEFIGGNDGWDMYKIQNFKVNAFKKLVGEESNIQFNQNESQIKNYLIRVTQKGSELLVDVKRVS